jgi:hypothetical protein
VFLRTVKEELLSRRDDNRRALTVATSLSSKDDSSYHQLMANGRGASAGAKGTVKPTEQEPNARELVSTITTAIHIPKDTWTLLRAVAFQRAQDGGGRASVSKLVAELVERHRRELEHEIK